jgi:hypothetical protein
MLQKIQMRPGVNREGTNYANEGGWYDGNKVRFRSGFPEKLGGWTQATPNRYFQGVCRMMINWVDLAGNNLIGVGTNLKYYINRGLGLYYDVTPITHTSTGLSSPFATVTGEQIVTVTDATYTPAIGDFVTFTGATGFNGLTAAELNTEFQITNVVDSTHYQITLPAGTTPNATGSGGGTVEAKYQINVGLPAATAGNGFGAGVWNGVNVATTYNTTLTYTSGITPWQFLNDVDTIINAVDTTGFPASGSLLINAEVIDYAAKTLTTFTGCTRGAHGSTATYHSERPTAGTPTPITIYDVTGYLGTTAWGAATPGGGVGIDQQLRSWSNDNFGQNLLFAPRSGPIYYWEDDTVTWARAVTLASDATFHGYAGAYVPTKTNQVIVSDVSRFVIAMGANSYLNGDPTTTFDPLLVRWSDQENAYEWVPDITNQSGEQRLTNGSYIVQAKKNRQEINIWTDSAIYSMQYLGPPYVFGFQLLMDNISIMGPNSAIVVNNVAYWMGTDKFYMYSGTVATLPCAVRQYIFEDISYGQRFQTVAGSNEGFNEVWWFYVSNDEVTTAASENRAPLNDKYVIYNYLERIWYYGTLSRTYWLDSPLQKYPMATFSADVNTGTIISHEQGNDNGETATTLPITAYIQSSDFDIGDGHNFGFVWRILPDVNFNGSNVNQPTVTMTVKPRQNSGTAYGVSDNPSVTSSDNYGIKNQYTVQQFTGQVYTRLRGRQMAFEIRSATLGVAWQLGSPRLDIKNDGRR